MTITSTSSFVTFVGDGVATAFPTGFRFLAPEHLVVELDGALLSEGVDYTVAGTGDDAGGTVTLLAALALGAELRITRTMPLVQETSFRTHGSFSPRLHEDALDRLTMQMQQVSRNTESAAAIPGIEAALNALDADVDALRYPIATGSFTPRALVDRLADVRNPLDFGAKADGATDCADAFDAILASFGSAAAAKGGRITIPPGTYRFSRPLHITRQVVIEGAGGNGSFGATVLRFDSGAHGIIVDRPTTSPDGGRGDWSVIRDVVVQAAGKAGTAHGVTLHARAELINLLVNGFAGNGIHIDCDVNYDPGTNANNWRISGGRVTGCNGHGLFTDGGDSNAGVCVGLDSSSNGGWGIYESSFLGNTYVGCHTAVNAAGAYRCDNPSARNVFIGCYSEGGQPTSSIVYPSLVLGGLHGAGLEGTGVFITAPFASIRSVRADIAGVQRGMELGNSDGNTNNSFVTFDVGGTQRMRWKYWPVHTHPVLNARNIFAFNWSNSVGNANFSLAGEGAELDLSDNNMGVWSSVAPTTPIFTRGHGFISGGSRVVHRASLPDSGTWNVGDVIYNRAPAPGGFVGWSCTESGTAGSYAEGLTATSAGAKAITLSAPSTVLKVGMVLTINAVRVRVATVSGTALTVDVNVPAGAALPIAFAAPTWKTFGAISP